MADDETIRTLEEWIDKYERAIEQCERGLLRTPEVLGLDAKFARELMQALPPGSTAFRIFDRRMHEVPPKPHYTKTGYVDESDCAHLRSRLALLHEIADQFGPEALRQIGIAKRQHHIAAGEYGRARRLVYGLMSKAATDLLIVDPYADESAFPYLESLAPTLQVRVIGGRGLSPAVKAILEGYQREGRKFEARRGRTIHDRYLVIDRNGVWNLGASINGLGAKAHTLSLIDDDAERAKIIAEIDAAWMAATPL